jgi:hypothetical protein
MERVEQKDQKLGKYKDGSEPVIGALIEVHRALYEACFFHELKLRGLAFERQRPVRITVTSMRQGLRRLSLQPLHLSDLPDLFVGPLVSLRAAPFNSVESSY